MEALNKWLLLGAGAMLVVPLAVGVAAAARLGSEISRALEAVRDAGPLQHMTSGLLADGTTIDFAWIDVNSVSADTSVILWGVLLPVGVLAAFSRGRAAARWAAALAAVALLILVAACVALNTVGFQYGEFRFPATVTDGESAALHYARVRAVSSAAWAAPSVAMIALAGALVIRAARWRPTSTPNEEPA